MPAGGQGFPCPACSESFRSPPRENASKRRDNPNTEVSGGTGLSCGHAYHTRRPSLIATLPLGYGDSLSRRLSNRQEVLVRGVRCPQVGRITMDMSLVDVTALRGQVALGDEAVIIGRQGQDMVTADELAEKLATINYEVVTRISHRVPRVAVEAS